MRASVKKLAAVNWPATQSGPTAGISELLKLFQAELPTVTVSVAYSELTITLLNLKMVQWAYLHTNSATTWAGRGDRT